MVFNVDLVLEVNFHAEDSLFVNMKAITLPKTSKYFQHPMGLSHKLDFIWEEEDPIFS